MDHGELAHKPLVAALAAFAIMGERGSFHRDAMMMLGSASLIPLKKPDGGVRPVAVGETLRRFVAKVVAARPATKAVIATLRPLQCGVSVPGACEAVGMGVAEAVRQLRLAPPA